MRYFAAEDVGEDLSVPVWMLRTAILTLQAGVTSHQFLTTTLLIMESR